MARDSAPLGVEDSVAARGRGRRDTCLGEARDRCLVVALCGSGGGGVCGRGAGGRSLSSLSHPLPKNTPTNSSWPGALAAKTLRVRAGNSDLSLSLSRRSAPLAAPSSLLRVQGLRRVVECRAHRVEELPVQGLGLGPQASAADASWMVASVLYMYHQACEYTKASYILLAPGTVRSVAVRVWGFAPRVYGEWFRTWGTVLPRSYIIVESGTAWGASAPMGV